MGNVTEIKTSPINLPWHASALRQWLSKAENHRLIIPAEAQHFQFSENTFSYTIPGTGDLSVQILSSADDRVVLAPWKRIPFEYECTFFITPVNDGSSIYIELNAQLNPLLKMMAVRPLQNLIDTFQKNIELNVPQ